MNFRIEQFKASDYPMLKSWWDFHGEMAPELEMMPETSYIMYFNNEPILSVSLLLTNTPIAWAENFIGNPELKGDIRKECGYIIVHHLEKVAKEHNKTRIFCMSMNKKTTKRYIDLGFNKTLDNVNTFTKEVF
jgi:hypothetical protein